MHGLDAGGAGIRLAVDSAPKQQMDVAIAMLQNWITLPTVATSRVNANNLYSREQHLGIACHKSKCNY